MMVNNLHDFSFIDIVNCLIFLIMVHKCYFFPVHIQEISSGNCSDTFSLFVNYRERTMTVFDHLILNIIRKILCIKSNQIICFHNIPYRNTLVDQSCDRKCIIRRHNNYNFSLMSKLYHLFADFNSHTNDNTANILRNRLKMILFSVSHDYQVIRFNIGFEHFRICSSHQNFSFCKISMLISLYYGTSNCLGNSSVLCLRS